jgi:hypothetical protein
MRNSHLRYINRNFVNRQNSHTAFFMRSSKSVILFILFLFLSTAGHSQFKNEDELKKQAAKYFDDEEYANGFKLYSQLVSNYPKDPVYNYRLGVCMLFTDADKKKAIPYLQIAAKTAKDNEKEALFYLGKAYHFNYQFDEAMSYYAQYKNIASASMIKKLQVDREIQACKNGKRLLSNLEELVVLEKKQLSEGDYFRSYDLKNIGGKLLVKPDEFRSVADKKKKDKSIVYLPKSNDQLYFAGYGEKGDNKDIYIVKKLPSGDWSKPENLGAPINTEFDEDYPFLHPNGTVLYFASKGQNSMGGFDLFKSELDVTTNRWKQPVNLAFPINSPNDDILFVTDSLEKIAFFASSRQSPAGKIDVFKILTEKRPAEFAFIKGTILKKDPNQSVLSKIKVKNIETGEDAGTFSAGADGNYSLKIPNGGKFIFTVETPGFPTQSEGVNIPTAYTYVPYKQAIGYETQKLYITNFFDAKADDENNYKEFLELIEQKSKMNVNADDFGVNRENPLAGGNNPSAGNNQQQSANNNQTKTTAEQPIANSNTATANPPQNKNVSNKELIQMAYDDATELQQSADSLKGDAATAFSAANSKQDQANQKKQEAEQTLVKANAETDAAKKQELTNEAEKQKDDATLYEAQSSTANNIAKQLEVDATNKQQEASLNLQYAKALEEAEKTKNNKQAITKLEDLQKQLETASKQKSNSNALLENIKADANNKQQELQSAEKKQDQIANDIKDITTEISSLDKQITETKDKDLIENYTAKKQEQESDLADKKKEQETNLAKINSLKEEAETLKSQADYATSIVGGNSATEIATNKSPENASATQNENKTTTQTNTQATNQESTSNTNQAANNATQNNESTNQQENKTPNNVEANQNQESVSNNTQALNNQTQSNQLTNNEAVNNTQANNSGPATDLINQVQNNFNDEKKVFGAVTYTDAKALQLKQQADEKFNGVLTDARNVEAQLQQINNQSSTSQTTNTQQQIDDLNKQANDLSAQARQLRKDAQTLTGTEKQNALDKISDFNKQATDLLYKAAKQQLDSDKNAFTNNDQNIQNLLKRPENKANAEQASQLAEEAAILNKTTQELTEEAEADPSIASRVGGLSNADEKQKSALAKQQEALKLLKGNTVVNGNVSQQLDELKNKLSQETQSANVALKTLSDANKAEYTASVAQLTQDEKKNKITPEIKDLQTQAQKNIQEAGAEIGKASVNKNEEDKRKQLLDANQKMEEAIKGIKQADQLLTGVVPSTNEVATNQSNETNNNTTASNEQNNQVNNTEAVSNNTITATSNEVQNSGQQNNTAVENKNINIEPANTNTVAITNNETQSNQLQNINENTVPSNTVAAVNNEIQNSQPSNNTQAQENATNANVVSTNTVTPSENQTAGNLNSQQINEIKSTPEYKQYTALQKETEKYNEQATKQQNQTDLYKNRAAENLKRAEQLKTDAATLSEGAEKQDKLAQAEKLELGSNTLKLKADSMQEIASGTHSFAESKKQEAEAYTQTLDKKTAENIEAVSTNKAGATVSSNTTTNKASNETVNNNNVSADKYAPYSETFKTNATQYDEKLNTAQAQGSSAENLKEQDGIISNYIKTIETEILQKKQEEAAVTSPTQKSKLTAAIKTLQSKRTALKQTLAANQKAINENKVAATNNSNQGQNNNSSQNNQATNNATNEAIVKPSEGSTEAAKYIGTKGFEIKQGNAYTASHPIPLNEKLPDGLVFRVQIGAFKNQIPLDAFKGLTPIGGETTPQGFIRYQAGLFDKYNNANAVKNDLKNLGYKDAFVVAYLNGKRVNLADALDTLKLKGEPVNTDATSTAGITANNNVPVNAQTTNVVAENAQPVQSSNLTTLNGLLFTIQIGVYTNNVSNTQLGNLKPIYREQLTNGNYRYTAGIYSDLNLVKTDRRKVNALGISDAFVSAYLNGQRIKITDAIDKVSNDKTIQFPTQQPILFPGETAAPQPVNANTQPTNTNPIIENNATGIQPFSNGVTESPAPTADNGVKANDEGVTFKVQIGAYRKQVPQQISDTWLKVKTWPIKYIQVNDIYIYTLGSFTEARFAQKLKDEVVSLGITDAFITVLKDGKKLSPAEAQQYLSR